jgi:hypothetical protein
MEHLAPIAAELAGIVKKYDTTRPVLAAAAFPELSSRIGFFDSLDMVGYNYKEQFYEADHQRFPRLPIIGSENGHHLRAWQAVTENDYIAGQFLWTGIDFLGEAGGWPVRGSLAGLLDTAGFEKTAYFRRKALWSGKPVLYLVSALGEDAEHPRFYRSWDYGPGDPITVLCYTSEEAVELFLNGKSLGIRRRGDRRSGAEDFPAWTIPFERGCLEARVPGTDRADTLESTLPAVRFRLNRWEEGENRENGPPDQDTDRHTGLPPSAYRLFQVELELLDEGGRLCVRENPLVRFSLTGEGKILGIENGDLADLTEYRAPWRRVCRGHLIVYVLRPANAPAPAGEAQLEASAEGFPPVSIGV